MHISDSPSTPTLLYIIIISPGFPPIFQICELAADCPGDTVMQGAVQDTTEALLDSAAQPEVCFLIYSSCAILQMQCAILHAKPYCNVMQREHVYNIPLPFCCPRFVLQDGRMVDL